MTMPPNDETPDVADAPSQVRSRAKPFPIIILVIATTILVLLWLTDLVDTDVRNFATAPVLGGTLLLCGGWFLCCSGYPAFWRRTVVGIGAAALAAMALVFRLDGYTGDMQPSFALRWSAKPYDRIENIETASDARSAGSDRAYAPSMPVDLLAATSHDYPQFLGPNRVPIVTSVKLARDWTQDPPQLVWRQPIGSGWSAFSIVGNYAVTQEQRGDAELIVCYELKSGKVAWSHADEGKFVSVLGGDGPRATPTIHRGRVYVQGTAGLLHCLEGSTGSVVWTRDIHADNGAVNLNWGRSGSPLVVDDFVIVSAGGTEGRSLVAYHRETGEPVWAKGNDVSSYASPAVANLSGIRQVLIVNQDWLAGHRLSDGELLWRHPWPGNSGSNASVSQAVPIGDRFVFVSKGYGIGSALLELSRDIDFAHPTSDDRAIRDTTNGHSTSRSSDEVSVRTVWEQPRYLKTKLTNVTYRDGYVYGLNQGILECVELETGKRQWKRGRYGHGQILLVDDLILVSAESGEVALVEASPHAYRELGRFQAIEGKTWNNPALSGPFLLVRNDEEAACYQLPLARP